MSVITLAGIHHYRPGQGLVGSYFKNAVYRSRQLLFISAEILSSLRVLLFLNLILEPFSLKLKGEPLSLSYKHQLLSEDRTLQYCFFCPMLFALSSVTQSKIWIKPCILFIETCRRSITRL